MDEHSYDSWGSESDRFQDGSLCIGIDLGTTNSCVGMWHVDRNHVKILKNHLDRGRTTPSVVHFKPNSDEVAVGNAAIALEYEPVGNTVRAIKRLMGQRFDSKAVQLSKRFATHSIVSTKQGNAAVQVKRGGGDVVLQPEEISAQILLDLKSSAEAYWESTNKQRIDNVVITVPAYFNDSQRKATILSAQMAGFKAIRLLNEPTAAAMAYGLFLSGEKHVVVFDFGGGTLDVSLLAICDGKFEVLGIGGDTNLGGEDINDLLIAFVLEELQKKRSVTRNALSRGDLIQIKRQVELAKVALSSEEITTIELEDLSAFQHDATANKKRSSKPFKLELTRAKFESLCASIWTRCLEIVKDVLTEADVPVTTIDEVIMVGGSTRIPIVRSQVSAFFGNKELCVSVNADEVVCEGAAIQAAILSGLDKRVFRDVLMMDVIPLPIGLQKADGQMEVLLPKNSRIPVSMTKYFETFEDNQRGLTVQVYEGEHEIAEENDHISDFSFALPRDKIGKAGEFRHPVTLTMNASGVLQVQAGIHHDSEEAPMSTTSLLLMVGYVVVLFLLWVYLRIMFADERIETAT